MNPFGIGDVLFTTPLLRAVRHAFPESSIGYLCNRRAERILSNNPHLNALFVYEKDELMDVWRTSRHEGLRHFVDLLRRVYEQKFDLVIDLSLGERYGLILKWFGVPRRVGFDYRRRGRFLSDALSIDGYHDVHVVEYYRRLLQFLGIQLLEASLELRVSEDDERWADRWLQERHLDGSKRLVGIVPAGGVSWGIDAPFRRWSSEGFAVVGDTLAEQYDTQVILFGEASDRLICNTVARLMRYPAIDLSGETTLGQFVSLLGRLSLIVCNDGGPLHLAVSQKVRTVSIFGPVDPVVYGPYPPAPSRHQVVCREGLSCRPCYHHFKLPPCPYERACLTTIRPEEVVEACEVLLDGQEAGAAVGPTDA